VVGTTFFVCLTIPAHAHALPYNLRLRWIVPVKVSPSPQHPGKQRTAGRQWEASSDIL
jgi:hypothetical protein